ncbi:MAG TPA: hypothetical protein VKA53_05015 [Thermoanaerobaculia bacterium]|nr:hypothetical protein [Thermoanaerobaculia bacterium]
MLVDGAVPLRVPASGTGLVEIELPASLSPGSHSLSWGDAEGSLWRCEFEVARIEARAAATTLVPGQWAKVHIEVEGTSEPVRLTIRNRTPQVVSLRGGEEQTVSTSGGAVNGIELVVTGRRRGRFDLSYRALEPRCPCGSWKYPEASATSSASPSPETASTASPGGLESEKSETVLVGAASGDRYRPCTKEEMSEESDDAALAAFLTDPQEAKERQELRRSLVEEGETLDYWRKLCERSGEERARADENRVRLGAIDDQIQRLAKELGVELPKACSQENCCPDGDCCRGLDPENADDRTVFEKRLKCLVDRFRSTNRSMQGAGSDFSWLYGRWRAGADHRAMMGFYDQLFSAVSTIIDDLTTSLGDRAKEVIETQLTSAGCSSLGLSPAACQAVRAEIQAAKDAKGAVDDVRSLIEADALPPAFIVKMVDAMARAAGNAAHTAVEGWEHFRLEMGTTLGEEYGRLVCLQAVNEALARQAVDCPRFCTSAVKGIEADLERRKEALEAADRQSRDAAATRLRAAEETAINPHIDDATSTSDRAWARACCQGGAGTVTVEVPGEEGRLALCAKMVSDKLEQGMGPLYCYLRNLEVTVECGGTDSIEEVNYTYGIEGRRRPGCCLKRMRNQ